MKETKYDGVAKITMHGREHIALLRPSDRGMVLHTMYYTEELHRANEADVTPTAAGKKEMALARQLIESLAGPFEPEKFHDEYKSAVLAMIDQKRKGEKVSGPKKLQRAPVIDLMEALKRSLKAGTAPTAKRGGTKRRAEVA